MTRQHFHKVLLPIFIVIFLSFCIYVVFALRSNPPAMLYLSPTQCGRGNWQGRDLPQQAEATRELLERAGLKPVDVFAYGRGEGTLCTGQTLLGPVSASYTPTVAANVTVSITFYVNSVADDDALGKVVVRILSALVTMKSADSIQLTFAAEQVKSIEFNVGKANELHRQGLSDAELFQALDGRYTPSTATPPANGE